MTGTPEISPAIRYLRHTGMRIRSGKGTMRLPGRRLPLVLFLLISAPAVHPEAPSYRIDDSTSRITFYAKSSLRDVNGTFKRYRLVSFQETGNTPRLTLEINTNTISTGDIFNDSLLRSKDFFDTARHPVATIRLLGHDTRTPQNVKIEITIKGFREEISFPMEAEKKNGIWSLTGGFWVNRRHFGMNYQSSLNPLQDMVRLQFQIQIIADQ